MPPLNVLVMEDNPSEAVMIERMLATDGQQPVPPEFACTHAANASLIPDLLSQTKIDAVLLDLTGPGYPGLESLRQFSALAPALPVVILTSPADAQLTLQAMQAGAQDYLVKGRIEAIRPRMR